MRKITIIASFLFLVFSVISRSQIASTQLTEGFKKDLQIKLKQQILTIRHFYRGDVLRYSADGVIMDGKEGIWPIDGFVQVKKVRFDHDILKLTCERLAAIYDKKQNNMRLANYEDEVAIVLPATSESEVLRLLNQVFVRSDENLAELVPKAWKHFAKTHEIRPTGSHGPKPLTDPPLPDEKNTFRVGNGVSAPVPKYHPDPSFTAFARKFRIWGTSMVQIVIDKNGVPQDFSIVRPLGGGLDEAALETVSTWRFEPARKARKPVNCVAVVEVSFTLY